MHVVTRTLSCMICLPLTIIQGSGTLCITQFTHPNNICTPAWLWVCRTSQAGTVYWCVASNVKVSSNFFFNAKYPFFCLRYMHLINYPGDLTTVDRIKIIRLVRKSSWTSKPGSCTSPDGADTLLTMMDIWWKINHIHESIFIIQLLIFIHW